LIKNNIPKGKNEKVLKMGQEVSVITKGKRFFLGYPRQERRVFGKLVMVGLKKSAIQLHEGSFLEGVKNDRITVTA